MNTEIVPIQQKQWTEDQMSLITDVVAKGATPDELKLFLYRCQNMGLDPLKPGQIHFVKYNPSSPGTIVVGIEGFRAIAHRSGKLSGISRGVTRDEKGKVISAWAEVHRSDWQHPAKEEVPMSEYNTSRGPWLKMPETMLKKVAEAAALRMAFPNELGGVYESAEMDQAEARTVTLPSGTVSTGIRAENPSEEDFPTQDHGYYIDFGKWNRKTLEQIYRDFGPDAIGSYINFLEESAKKKGQAIDPNGKVAIFIKNAEAFLGAMENGGPT